MTTKVKSLSTFLVSSDSATELDSDNIVNGPICFNAFKFDSNQLKPKKKAMGIALNNHHTTT